MAQRKPLKKELRFVKSGMKMYYKNTLGADFWTLCPEVAR